MSRRMTCEEKREKKKAADRRWRANMTEKQRAKKNAYQRAWRANMTKERREKKNAYQRDRYANMTEKQREKQDARRRDRHANMTDEQREKVNAAQRQRTLKKHGITPEQYDRQLEAQDGKCAICGGRHAEGLYERLVPDHDHETGDLRGLLCHKDNRGLGLFGDNLEGLLKPVKYLIGDDPERLAAAISYLKRKK